MIKFTEYMNKSLAFREVLKTYCLKNGYEAKEIRERLEMLDSFDKESERNNEFRNDVFEWFNGTTSTIKLRQLSLHVGYDYFENLKNGNIIDSFDTANIK